MFCFANCITVSHRLFARHLKIWNFRKWYLRKHLWNSSKMPLKCLWNASKMPPKRLPSASKSYLLSSCKSWIEGKKLPSIQLLPLGLMDAIRHGVSFTHFLGHSKYWHTVTKWIEARQVHFVRRFDTEGVLRPPLHW